MLLHIERFSYHRKTNHQKHAKAHRDHLEAHFSKIDSKQGTCFAKALLEHCPKEPEKKSKKRKSTDSSKQPKKAAKTGEQSKTLADMSQAEREEYAMDNLRKYIQEVGGELWCVVYWPSYVVTLLLSYNLFTDHDDKQDRWIRLQAFIPRS